MSSRSVHVLGVLSISLGALLAPMGCAAKQQKLPQLPPPAPILADAADTPGTAAEECSKVAADLERYSKCGLLDDDRRWWVGRWAEYVKTDLELAKNPKLDDDSLKLLAVSCRKAASVVGWAAEVCLQQAAEKEAAEAAGGATPAPSPAPPGATR